MKAIAILARKLCVCTHCKKEYVNKSRNKKQGGKYCSRECSFSHKAKIHYSKVFFNTCIVCSTKWVSKRKTVLWCSVGCGKEQARRDEYQRNALKHHQHIKQKECNECRKEFIPEYGDRRRKFCSLECSRRNIKRNAKAVRRAKTRGAEAENINVAEIFRRDRWKCRCCGIKTPWTHRGTIKQTAPELDHIIPLSKGGKHIRANVQLLCRRCNGNKLNNHANDQMLLFG